MTKDEILAELEGMTAEEVASRIGRSKLAEWWELLYGKQPPKSRTAYQLAYDMLQMVRMRNRAQVLARGLMLH